MARFRIWSNTAEYLSLRAIQHAGMAALYDYWRGAATDGGLPRQKDLSIHAMPDCLANIALIDVMPAGDDPAVPPGMAVKARYLMVGDALKKLLGEDPTGLLINEVYSKDVAEEVARAFQKAMDGRCGLYYRREFQILTKSFGYDRLILPMRLQGSEVRRLLLCIYPLDSKLTSADQWRGELAKVEEMERAEARMATAWAESLGFHATVEGHEPEPKKQGTDRPNFYALSDDERVDD